MVTVQMNIFNPDLRKKRDTVEYGIATKIALTVILTLTLTNPDHKLSLT